MNLKTIERVERSKVGLRQNKKRNSMQVTWHLNSCNAFAFVLSEGEIAFTLRTEKLSRERLFPYQNIHRVNRKSTVLFLSPSTPSIFESSRILARALSFPLSFSFVPNTFRFHVISAVEKLLAHYRVNNPWPEIRALNENLTAHLRTRGVLA